MKATWKKIQIELDSVSTLPLKDIQVIAHHSQGTGRRLLQGMSKIAQDIQPSTESIRKR